MLYMMRHGRTDWNNKRLLQGRTDIPLNDEGREMAIAAREIYKNVNIDICYCSPLGRARETAELFLAGRDIPVICDDRLVEMSFGIYEGTSVDFNDDDSPKNLFFNHPERYEGAENGETFEELFRRTGDFLENVAYPLVSEGKDVLIIGHGAMNASLYCQVKNLPLSEFWSSGRKNCELITLKTTTNNIHPLK